MKQRARNPIDTKSTSIRRIINGNIVSLVSDLCVIRWVLGLERQSNRTATLQLGGKRRQDIVERDFMANEFASLSFINFLLHFDITRSIIDLRHYWRHLYNYRRSARKRIACPKCNCNNRIFIFQLGSLLNWLGIQT